MANSKISALTSATTPLAGTEVLPVVQSSATTQVTVANLTAGRAVSAASFSATGKGFFGGATTITGTSEVVVGTNTSTGISTYNVNSAGNSQVRLYIAGVFKGGIFSTGTGMTVASAGQLNFSVDSGSTNAVTLSSASNLTISTGNVVQGTAAKGFDFSANTPLAGKTSTVLNWYEEGTWTPNQGAGLTLVGAFSSTGKYTRVGRNVTVSGTVTGATSVAVTAGGVITTSLPFTIGTAGHGNATNAANTASAAIICNTGTTVTSAAAIAATGTITFSATYFV
jgi:hypothetical protein